VGFPVATYSGFTETEKLVFSGNPVRKQVIGTPKPSAIKNLKLPTDKPIVFIFGGSQGTAVINEAIFNSLEILTRNYCLIHQTGQLDIERARFLAHNLPDELRAHYHPFDFLQEQMGDAFGAADVVVGRASAGTIAEIAANKKPALLIPNSHSANAHQQKNADVLARMGAVRIMHESELNGLRLQAELDRITHDKKAMDYLQDTIAALWNPHSAETIAKLIIRAGRGTAE